MKGDFTPKYKTIQDILADASLTPDERTREEVKHHAMCLFALACDLAGQEQKFLQAQRKIVELKNTITQCKNALEVMQEKIDKRNKVIAHLRQELKGQGAEASPRKQRANADGAEQQPKLPRRIPLDELTSEQKQAIQAEYYEKRIAALAKQVQYWRDKATGGGNGK